MKKPTEIALTSDVRSKAVAALRQYAAENWEEAFGELKASLLFDFVVSEIGPSIYNQALADARAFFEERVADLDATLSFAEFPTTSRRSR